jgi:ATP-binding cassette subfamily F protein 3
VGAILHLEDRKLTLYQGPYDQFARQRAEKLALADAMSKKQEARRAHLQSYVDRFRYKADKARQAQSRLKALARMQPISSPQEAALRAFTFPTPEEMSPPIIHLEGGVTGYGDTPVLSRLDLRIDQDDRIALLGRNGQGKSTLSKLLSDRLPLMAGKVTRSSKLRIGYFAQHQVDELHVDETPLDHLRRLRPDETPAKLRARLAGFGLGPAQAETQVGRLSGGQKARLSLLIATIDAPHMLILDEPTNHLDIESREALVEALTAYSGAVILVSHDMHLLSLVADRLWLVSGGTVRPFDGDLESYRDLLLGRTAANGSGQKSSQKKAAGKPRPSRDAIAQLRTELRKCEARMEKLEEMREELARRLGDPSAYEEEMAARRDAWQRKYSEVMDALGRAEALWMKAAEKLEAAEAAS